jgi:predicted nucleic acid-binding protein
LKPEEVPAGPVLLDTTAFSHLLRGGAIAQRLAALTADHELVVSFITVGEVMDGAIEAKWGETKLAALELKLAGCAKAVGSERVAREYGRIKAHFRGTKGENDLWIAACSLAEDNPLPIVTTDKDFDQIGVAFGITIVRPD